MQKGHQLQAGETVMFSSGCYSDYSVHSIGRLLKPLNESVWDEMCAAATVKSDWWPEGRFQSDAALEWLRANDYIEEVEYVELHLGDYAETPSWANA